MFHESNFIIYFKKGDERVLDYIVNQYLGIIKTITTKILYNNKEDIEECINDIFFSIWKNRNKFYGNSALDFKKWIFKVSKFKAIDYYRKNIKNNVIETNDSLVSNSFLPEESVILKEEQKEIFKILDELKDVDRKIFIMKYYLGMKSESISRILNLTPSAVDNRVYRGKKFLKDKILGS